MRNELVSLEKSLIISQVSDNWNAGLIEFFLYSKVIINEIVTNKNTRNFVKVSISVFPFLACFVLSIYYNMDGL